MTAKKQYYKLDDIGLIGTQDRTPEQIKKDMKKMAEHIRAEKVGKVIAFPKRTRRFSKAK